MMNTESGDMGPNEGSGFLRTIGIFAVTLAWLLAATISRPALAEDVKPDPKPATPSLSDILSASGLTVTGYVDGTYSYQSISPSAGSTENSNTFGLNQASLSLAYLPSSGFGALVNPVAGTEALNGCYAPGYLPCSSANSTNNFNLLQAYVQYIGGPSTVLLGKFVTLAGAEVAAPTGNVNITRSLLYWYSEPVTLVGARLTYAASASANLIVGVNNGWNVDTSTGTGKTLELGFSLAPSKALAITGAGYYGDVDRQQGLDARTLVDLVATWTVTPKLTVIGNVDWDKQDFAGSTSATWWGVAAYANYAINDTWRTALRLEYLDDQDGYATGLVGSSGKLNEGTLTFGYAASKNFELRFEGRYDTAKPDVGQDRKTTQAWLQALYKF